MTAAGPAALHAADDRPVHDPSGLLGQPSGTPPPEASEEALFTAWFGRAFPGAAAPVGEPEPPDPGGTSELPTIHQGPRTPSPVDDGAVVDAYCATFFPGSVGSKT